MSRLRIWAGEEREGSVRRLTLFVQSRVLDGRVLDAVARAKGETGADRVYLGAWDTDVEEFAVPVSTLRPLFSEVMIERDHSLLGSIRIGDFDRVVVRLGGQLPPGKVVLKTLDPRNVYLYENPVANALDDRCRMTGMYEGDTLLLETDD